MASLRRANTADHAAEIGVMGLLTKPSFSLSTIFAPTERSSAHSSAVLILRQRWSLCSFIDLQTYCGDFVAPARSKPACLRCRAKFGPPAGKSRPVDSVNPARSKLRPGPMDIAKALMRTDVKMCWSVTRNRCEPPPCRRRSVLLWRQATQTILTLDAMRRPPSAPARRLFRRPMVLSYWDLERSGMR